MKIIPTATSQNAFRLAIISNILLGTHVIATKISLDTMEPVLFTTLRHIVMGLVLVWMLPNLAFMCNAVARRALVIQTVLAATVMVLYIYGLDLSTATSSAILSLIIPVLIYFFSIVMLKEPLLRQVMAGGLVALIGSLLMIGLPAILNNQFSLGDSLLLAAYVVLAVLVVHSKQSYKVLTPEQVLGVRTLGASLVLLLSMFLFLRPSEMALGSPVAWLTLAYSTIVTGVIGQLIYYRSLEKMSAERSAPLFYLDPMVGVLLSGLILGEVLQTGELIGAAVIVVGVAISHPVHVRLYHRVQVMDHPSLLAVVRAMFRSFHHSVANLRIVRFAEEVVRRQP